MKILNIEKLITELEESARNICMKGDPSFSIPENAVIGAALEIVIAAIEESTEEYRDFPK